MDFFGSNTLAIMSGLGGLFLVLGVISIILLMLGLIAVAVFIKTRKVLIPSATLFIVDLLEVPLKRILWIFRSDEEFLDRMAIEIRNRIYRNQFLKTPYHERMLFLPQCLRNPKCPAALTPEGIMCVNCGRCGIGRIKEEAEKLGYRVFIAPGSTLIKRMVKKYRPKAILGVGCFMEVKEGSKMVASINLPVQGIILKSDGCVDTRADIIELMETLKSEIHIKDYRIEDDPLYLTTAQEIAGMWNGLVSVDVKVRKVKK